MLMQMKRYYKRANFSSQMTVFIGFNNCYILLLKTRQPLKTLKFSLKRLFTSRYEMISVDDLERTILKGEKQ